MTPEMRRGAIASGVLHVVLLVALLISLPSKKPGRHAGTGGCLGRFRGTRGTGATG